MRHAFLALVPLALLGAQEDAERLKKEKEHDASQRPIQLQLVSASYDRVKLEDVLADITRQRGTKFIQQVHPTPELSLILKSVSIRQLYDAIEDQLDVTFVEKADRTEVRHRKWPRKPRAHAPGIAFEFRSKRATLDGKHAGSAIRARSLGPGRPYITDWEVIGVDNKALALERCDVCGPLMVFAKGGEGTLRVRLKGKFLWDSIYTLEVADPAVRQEYRVGEFTVAYEFPKVKVSSAEEIPYWEFPTARLEGTYKDGKSVKWRGGGIYDRMDGADPAGWCECPPGPKPVVVPAPTTRKSNVFTKHEHQEKKPSDFQGMKVIFQKPIQESFETETVVPADTPRGPEVR